jgi:hypothetical protein
VTPTGDEELALEQGGPSWKLWLRTGLAPAEVSRLGRRALVLAGLCWLPLLGLSLFEGVASGDRVHLPFLRDLAAYARFLLGVTLLVLADVAVAPRLRTVLLQFPRAGLLARDAEPEFRAAITAARRLLDSVAVEVCLLALSYVGTWFAVQRQLENGRSTWHAIESATGESLSLAGWWYALVSVPLFQFLFLRWIFRGFVWSRLLARISRLDLHLVASHPDRAAGLGFLSVGQASFAVLVLAASASLSAVLADELLYHGAALESFYPTIAGFLALSIVLVLAPLLSFAPRLAALKRAALLDYGALSSRHDTAFHRKWLSSPPEAEAEALLGNEDPSSLADLATGYERAKALRPIPVDLSTIAPLVLAALLPMVPLIATKVPLREILKGLMRVVM